MYAHYRNAAHVASASAGIRSTLRAACLSPGERVFFSFGDLVLGVGLSSFDVEDELDVVMNEAESSMSRSLVRSLGVDFDDLGEAIG